MVAIYNQPHVPTLDKSRVFLVVDDFEAMRRVTANQLRQLGAEKVLAARDGKEALRFLHSQRVDVILSDWNMPVMTGLDLLKKIRESTQYANLPVLMMTAETERHQVQIAIEAGVSGYMVKPFNVGALESKEALAADGRVPFLVVRGRRGGSAMTAAAINALASDIE